MRFKNRYILLEIKAVKRPEYLIESEIEFLGEIKESMIKNFGILGYAKTFSSLKIVYFNLKANFIMIRVSRSYFNYLKNCLFLMKKFKDSEIRFKILFVTGTIKKLEQKILLEFKKSKNHEILKIAQALKNEVDN